MEYLTHVPSFKLTYRRRSELSNGLSGYCDSDWANSVSRRSTTGNLFLYNRTPISWRSKLQKTISLSTAEAEYYSASAAAVEVTYLRYLLKSMGFAPKTRKWTPVYEDNNACIEWGNNVIGGRERAKHIDIRKHFAHEAIQNGHLRLVRVDTSEQLADIFTKGLHHQQWENCVSAILTITKPNFSPEIPDFSRVDPEKNPVVFPSGNFAGANGPHWKLRSGASESSMCRPCAHGRRAMAALKLMS